MWSHANSIMQLCAFILHVPSSLISSCVVVFFIMDCHYLMSTCVMTHILNHDYDYGIHLNKTYAKYMHLSPVSSSCIRQVLDERIPQVKYWFLKTRLNSFNKVNVSDKNKPGTAFLSLGHQCTIQLLKIITDIILVGYLCLRFGVELYYCDYLYMLKNGHTDYFLCSDKHFIFVKRHRP